MARPNRITAVFSKGQMDDYTTLTSFWAPDNIIRFQFGAWKEGMRDIKIHQIQRVWKQQNQEKPHCCVLSEMLEERETGGWAWRVSSFGVVVRRRMSTLIRYWNAEAGGLQGLLLFAVVMMRMSCGSFDEMERQLHVHRVWTQPVVLQQSTQNQRHNVTIQTTTVLVNCVYLSAQTMFFCLFHSADLTQSCLPAF